MRRATRHSLRGSTALAVALLLGACIGREGVRLDDPQTLSAPTAVGTAPMFVVSPAGREAAAWVSAPEGGTDGRLYVSIDGGAPAEVRDTLGPIEPHGEAPPKLAYGPDGALNAIYVVPKIVPGRRFPAAALRFIRSRDGGRTWAQPVTVTDDSLFGSHNFHALHAAADGALYVTWLDGRHGKSAAYMSRSTDGGRTWAANVRVGSGEACPCCRTAVATSRDGTLHVAWRAVLPGTIRDVVVARSSDQGATWDEPVRVHADNWVFDACPHAGPALQVDSRGVVHVAWWTGKEGAAGVYYARSTDGARSFGAPVPLGVADFSRPAHVQLAVTAPKTVAVTWDDGTKQIPNVLLRVSRDGGVTFAPAIEVSDPGQKAGYPVIAAAGNRLTVAWSQQAAGPVAQGKASHKSHGSGSTAMLHAVGDAQVLVRRGRLQ
jgi:hypothetical protein